MTKEQYKEYKRNWRERNKEHVQKYERKYWRENNTRLKIQRVERTTAKP